MIETIKQRINCVDYARRANLPIFKPGDRCVSPLRDNADNKTAFVVYEDFFYDFVSRQGGDVIDMCAMLKHNGDRGKAICELASITGVDAKGYTNWVAYTQNLNNQIQKWHEALTQETAGYLASRHINRQTIDTLKIGQNNGRIVIPYWKNGYICYWISRGEDPKYLKAKSDDLNENIPWGVHTLDRDTPLIIAEGAFDALSFYQEGYKVLATMGGHFSSEQRGQVLAAARASKSVILTFDSDDAGKGFTLEMAQFLFLHRIPFAIARLPEKCKDVSDYYADGGDLAKLVKNAEDGLQYLAAAYTDEDAFKGFIYQVRRYVDKPSIVKLFKAVARTDHFDSEVLAEIRKGAMQPPSEDEIARAVIQSHRLLYHPKIGFFEYVRNRWVRQSDEQVKQYVAHALGRHKSGSKCNSILGLVKAETVHEITFNQKKAVNFINGTLELDGLHFREHRADDYLTYCMDYPYAPGKYCTAWSGFIDEITAGDGRKASLLQEAAGYVLYPNNELQKAFVLIGEGANGKSVYLKVLTALFGTQNVSNIEMSALAKDFQAIHLMNSLLNISAETKSDVTGAESIFKQIVGGDSISSCYKGKDMISFVPRSKLFIACNEYMRSKDTTEGYLRRLCFVRFPMHYVEDPDPANPNDRQLIPDLEQRFMPHLSEIFNWVLDGYRMLQQAHHFTETDEQADIIGEYKEVINPLICFVKEYELPAPTYCASNEEFYKDYAIWCQECGHKPRSRQSFLKAVAPLLKKYRPDVEKPEGVFRFNGKIIRGIRSVTDSGDEPLQQFSLL